MIGQKRWLKGFTFLCFLFFLWIGVSGFFSGVIPGSAIIAEASPGEYVPGSDFVKIEQDPEGEQFTITVTAEPPDGGEVDGDGTYDEGEEVTISADSSPLYKFLEWTENDQELSATDKVYSFPARSDHDFVAHFERTHYEIEVSADPVEGCTVTGGDTYEVGETVTVEAKPNLGYELTSWTVDGEERSTDTTYSFEANEDLSLKANFAAVDYDSLLYWQHEDDGKLKAWQMKEEARVGTPLFFGEIEEDWEVKGVVDATGNDNPDIYLYNPEEGLARLWLMEGLEKVEAVDINNPADHRDDIDPAWDMMAVYDLDGSGEPDIIWQALEGPNEGHLAVWMMEDQASDTQSRIFNDPGEPYVDPSWEIGAIYDLLGDDEPEVIWQAVGGNHEDQLAYWKLDMETFERVDSGRIYNDPGDSAFDADWRLNASVDLFGDDIEEFLFHNIDGSLAYWQLDVDDPDWGVIRKDAGRLDPEEIDQDYLLVGATGVVCEDKEPSKIWQHEEHANIVKSVEFAEVGGDNVVFSGGRDNTVIAYDYLDEEIIWQHEEHDGNNVRSLEFAEVNGQNVVFSGGRSGPFSGMVIAYDYDSEEVIWQHEEHGRVVQSVEFAEVNGRNVVFSGSDDDTVIAYDYDEEEIIWQHEEHDSCLRSIEFIEVGSDNIVLSVGRDNMVIAYDYDSEEVIWQHEEHDDWVYSVDFAEVNGRNVVFSGSRDDTMIAYDYDDEEVIWQHKEYDDSVLSVDFAEVNGRNVVFSGSHDDKVTAFDFDDEEVIWWHDKHGRPVRSVKFAEINGRNVVFSGGSDETVIAYDSGL